MVNAFAQLGEVAFEKEVTFVTEHLRADRTMMYQLSSLLKDGTLKSLLNGEHRSAVPQTPAVGARKLNLARQKKWRHLKPSEASEIMALLEPNTFGGGAVVPEDLAIQKYLYVALHVQADTPLPHTYWPDCIVWSNLLQICQKRYEVMGSWFKDLAIGDIFGYWDIVDNKLKCIVNMLPCADIPFFVAGAIVKLEDPFSPDCEITITARGRTARLQCQEMLPELGIALEDPMANWVLGDLGASAC